MTQVPSQTPVIQVKPQPNIYTLLMLVGILMLGVTIGVVLYNLLSNLPTGYALTFGQVLKGQFPGG